MNWLTYIIPRLVFRTKSPYNRDIRVIEESGKNKLLVNGSSESGEFVRRLWSSAFLALGVGETHTKVSRILVLGVAGGTVIHMLRRLYPQAAVVGVDIDKTMIGIGKKFFGLGTVHSLKLVCDDAKHYVKMYKGDPFDCIVADVFIGSDSPSFLERADFHTQIKRMLTRHGYLLVNYAFRIGAEDVSLELRTALSALYPVVRQHTTRYNRFFLAK